MGRLLMLQYRNELLNIQAAQSVPLLLHDSVSYREIRLWTGRSSLDDSSEVASDLLRILQAIPFKIIGKPMSTRRAD